MYQLLNRFSALVLIIVFSPFLIIFSILIFLDDGYPIFFNQERIGRNNTKFIVFKFRTMKINTPNIATHLMESPDQYYTRFGIYFRKFSIDELPQLINIICGDMFFVGPRPALYNQLDLIKLRTDKKIHKLFPGVTGWAQVNGRDSISIKEKVSFDEFYLKNKNFILDLKIIFKTMTQLFNHKNVAH